MNKRGKEINGILFGASLNTAYLPEEDKYYFKKEEPKYRFNVIGAGMMAMEHIRVTLLEGRGTIRGIYDNHEHSVRYVEKLFHEQFPDKELTVFPSLLEAVNDPLADGLILCTPNYSHIEIVREAIRSGKHILLEKPMVTKLGDGVELLDLVKDYPAIFQVGLQYRYKAIYVEAREEILKKKALGEVHTISIVEHRLPFLDKIDQWNKFSEFSGGTLVEKCCHYFDLFNLFAQSKPEYVYAVGGQGVNFIDFEYGGKVSDILDHAIVVVVYENGVKCNFNLCMFSPMFYEEITVCGTQGRLRAYENEDYLPIERPHTHLEILTADYGTSKVSTPCYPMAIQTSGHMGGTYYEHKNFIDNIEGRKTDTATVEEGFWSVVVGIAAEQSVKTGGKVYIRDLLADYPRFMI